MPMPTETGLDTRLLPTWPWITVVAYLETISDATLAELLYDYVWAGLTPRTLPDDLVAEAIARLSGRSPAEEE